MTDAPKLAALFERLAEGVEVPEQWRQGRTAYGGLSAALAFHAARASFDDPPPLRSAQIAFVGPLAGMVTTRTELLRRGRSAAFVSTDLSGEAGLALRGCFIFGGARPSAVSQAPRIVSSLLAPGEVIRPVPRDAPRFVHNFEVSHGRPQQDATPGELFMWVRLADDPALDPLTTLILLGDALPPAAITYARTFGPISSMNWQVDVLTDTPATRDGWWLLRSTATQVADGFSSQTMAAWNSDGVQVLAAMQTVALFL